MVSTPRSHRQPACPPHHSEPPNNEDRQDNWTPPPPRVVRDGGDENRPSLGRVVIYDPKPATIEGKTRSGGLIVHRSSPATGRQ
jgi:hypothetical protein